MNFIKYLVLLLFFSLPVFSKEAYHQKLPKDKIKRVVIDAGHGGKDSGALGSFSKEKDITLKLALLLGEFIKTYMPDVEVIYTRDTDIFIPLYERAGIANRSNADIFISIHCNSVPKKSNHIQGTETFVMGLHNTDENLLVAQRENESILLEEDYQKKYSGFDPNSPEAYIMLSMFQNVFMGHSLMFAEKIETQFKTKILRKSRGVKQAGFVVLKETNMPSVLVEAGFLSNKEEEIYLNSEKGQYQIASSIYRAFREYREILEQREANAFQDPPELEFPEPITEKVLTDEIIHSTTESVASQEIKSELLYKVQLSSSPVKLTTTEGSWTKVKDLEVSEKENNFKYFSGRYLKMKDAVAGQNFWRANGFKDAFVVAFLNGEKISTAKAIEISGE